MAALTAHRPSANPMKSEKIRLNHSTCLFMSLPHVTLRARNGVPIPDRCCYQAFALINLLDYPLHHDWLRFDCVYHLHKSRTETTTSEVFRCGIFACSSLFWRWCSLHSESSSRVARCSIFTETIFGHSQPAKNPCDRVRLVSISTLARNSCTEHFRRGSSLRRPRRCRLPMWRVSFSSSAFRPCCSRPSLWPSCFRCDEHLQTQLLISGDSAF